MIDVKSPYHFSLLAAGREFCKECEALLSLVRIPEAKMPLTRMEGFDRSCYATRRRSSYSAYHAS